MAFLDNSGDIILDAVLTDTGRLRLAKGDGTFKIVKFALADDEINYNLYDKSHPSGSAYYDLDVLQTPIFEAFTNNTSVVKHPLLSISRTNLLFLPVIKINTNSGQTGDSPSLNTIIGTSTFSGSYLVAVDSDTVNDSAILPTEGIFDGYNLSTGGHIRVDQGIDSTQLSAADSIDSILKETQYSIEIDNRLGIIVNGGTGTKNNAAISFIDDDDVASYYFSEINNNFVEQIEIDPDNLTTNQVISGPRGTCLGFQIRSTLNLQTSTFLFTTLGGEASINGVSCYYIDTNVVVRGLTTGSSITIPVRFIKKQ